MEHTNEGHGDAIAATPNPSIAQRKDLIFHGDGTEYFKIWIVNLTLTIVTLGIYSAWATVRTKKYFYGSTELAGDRFDYHADPIVILKGRLIAVAALVLYTVTQSFFVWLSLILLFALILLVPWIAVRALRFNAIMSSWRGIRFGFDGTAGEAAKAYLLWPLFGIITLGFGMPYAWYEQNKFKIPNHRFGNTRVETDAKPGDFYQIFFALFAAGIGGVILIGILAFATAFAVEAPDTEDPSAFAGVVTAVIMLMYVAFYVALYVIYAAMNYNVSIGLSSIGPNKIRTDVTVMGWFKIIFVNTLGMIVTLGIYYPWARVRMTQYILSHTWVDAEDLDSFTANELDQTSALGAEMGDAFDLGLGV